MILSLFFRGYGCHGRKCISRLGTFYFTIGGLSLIFYFKLHNGYCIFGIKTIAFVYYIALILTQDGKES